MRNRIESWIQTIDALINTAYVSYESVDTGFYEYIRERGNKVIEQIQQSEYGKDFELPIIPYQSYVRSTHLRRAILILDEVRRYLLANSDLAEKKIERLKKQNTKLRDELDRFEEKEEEYLRIIKQFNSVRDYEINTELLKELSKKRQKLVLEAVAAYNSGAYTPCVCSCRTILEDIVQDLCKEHTINEGSLKSQINELIEKGVIKESSHQSKLVDLTKYFGQRAAHPTTEIFDRDKANLALSSIFILMKEIQ